MPSVITGANRGVGAGLMSVLRDQGHDVIGTTRRPMDGLVTADVTDKASLEALAHALDGSTVPLLVCNAGVLVDRSAQIETDYTPEDWATTLAVNTTGVFLSVQAMLPLLRAAAKAEGLARIAIISSQLGSSTQASGGMYIYRASKAAALNLGRNLAQDLAPDRIAVGIYHPGWVRTDMGTDAAAISVEESATGLAREFAALDLKTTGCFRTWDGRDHPY